ncbi:MAG: hypothetical protein K2N09_02780 [Muribaculaceae bacterium]|nr:hypothetical protein [Muribaculaceae bacterium]
MKNPLTSKERRGLLAVAAAALLCIGSGFILRSIGSHGPGKRAPLEVMDDSLVVKTRGDGGKADSVKAKKPKRVKKRKAEKIYPTRNPLDEPCD